MSQEGREGWGMSVRVVNRVLRPEKAEDVVAAFALAKEQGLTVAFWGNGRSYGDAALNEGNLLIDFSRMNGVISWDADSGKIVVEPGLTLAALWQRALVAGWWPPVVSGTMFTTIGGLAAANAHGKNNFKHGPIGEHILSFEFVTPDGQRRKVTRDSDPDLFHAAIGGFGWLGAFVAIELQLKRVHSGRLEVHPFVCADLDAMFAGFERCNEQGYDYVVGWVDAFPNGASLGRGQIHAARYVEPGVDLTGQSLLLPEHQSLPDSFFGVIPKRILWRFVKPFANRLGMRLINWARYTAMSRPSASHVHFVPHAQFNFLLDFVPDWKRIYEPGGLIQYQLFLPKDSAKTSIRRVLEMGQGLGLEPWLVVMKRHRPDAFWLSHAVDGYSFALDFPVTAKNRELLWKFAHRMDEVVADSGGRFYFAKDQVVRPEAVRKAFGAERLGRFLALKQQVDPEDRLQSNLFRRVLAPLRQGLPSPRPVEHTETIVPLPVSEEKP